jgi:hypothetical protein
MAAAHRAANEGSKGIALMAQSIDFSLDYPPVIYITTDPNKNILTLTLKNQSGALMLLKGGTPVEKLKIHQPGSPTTFYINFGQLLTTTELNKMVIAAEEGVPGLLSDSEWKFAFWKSYWGISPAADLPLPDQESVTFTLTKFLASGQPRPGQLTIDYFNFPQVPDGVNQIEVFLQNPRVEQKDLGLNFDPGNVVYTTVTTPVANRFSFTMSNPSKKQPIVTKDWGVNPPVFNIAFTYSEPPGYGALTTPKRGAEIHISVVDKDQRNWGIDKSPDGLYWILKPTLSTNKEVFAAGASVELALTNVVTDLPAGSPPDNTTFMYIQYANLPEYNDGFFQSVIFKAAGPGIAAFYCDPMNPPMNQQSTPGTVYWVTQNCSKVSFTGGGISPDFYGPSASLPATVAQGQEIKITAYAKPYEADPHEAKKQTQDLPSVTSTLTPPTVNVSSVPLPFSGAGTIVLLNPTTAYVFQSIFFAGSPTALFAVVNLTNNQMTSHDLGTAIDKSYGNQFGIMGVAVSPTDASKIYVLVRTQPYAGHGHLLLLTITVATNAMAMVLDLGQIDGLSLVGNLAFTPDGETIYLSSLPGGFWTITVSNLQITKFNWPPPPQGPDDFCAYPPILLGTSPDGTKALICGLPSFAVFDVHANFKLLHQFIVLLELPEYIAYPMFLALSSNAQQFFITAGPNKGSGAVYILGMDIDQNTWEMKIGQKLPIRYTGADTLGPLALGPGDALLYNAIANQIVVYDRATFATFDPTFAPATINAKIVRPLTMAVAHSGNVIYTTGGGDWTMTTVTPWPWTQPSLKLAAAGGAPRHSTTHLTKERFTEIVETVSKFIHSST